MLPSNQSKTVLWIKSKYNERFNDVLYLSQSSLTCMDVENGEGNWVTWRKQPTLIRHAITLTTEDMIQRTKAARGSVVHKHLF